MNSRVLLMLLAVMTTGLTQEHKAPEVRSLHVTSDITYRFATTLVHSRVANPVNTSQEIGFKVTLPKSAFITKFSMTIDGIVYDGEIKEKEAANKQYEKAKSKGQSAGRVQQEKTTRDSTVFRVSVNVAAMDKVDFNMTYEELLNRRLGLYSHWINIDPGQVVEDLSVKVKISESRNITTLNVPPLKEESANSIDTGDGNQLAVITWEDTQTALVTYEPTPAQQAEVSEDGLRGQFIVEYDVQRDRDAGEIQVIDGYFVHYIAPAYLEPMPKDVMFILDDSGSMSGQKITQTKEAMYTILDQLQPADRFNLLSFSFSTNFWRTESLAHATEDNIALAKEFVSEMRASGGTNINAAVAGAMEYLHRLVMGSEERRPTMIIFLTDGDPTEGVTDPNIILNNVRSANTHNTALYSLGFGNDVDFSFLQKMSLQNNGLARKIYSDSDADLQLKDFYREVSSPLLSDLNISYVGPSVDEESVTTINRILFEGSEIVLAGRLSGSDNFEAVIKADAAEGEVEMRLTCVLPVIESRFRGDKTTHFTERLWAYLTIKKLLDDMKELTNNTEKENAKSRAMELSLKYSFVTPLTSMVVTKPDRDPEQSEVKDGDDEETRRSGRMSQGPGLPGLTGIAGYPAMPYQPPSRPAGRNRGPAVPMFDSVGIAMPGGGHHLLAGGVRQPPIGPNGHRHLAPHPGSMVDPVSVRKTPPKTGNFNNQRKTGRRKNKNRASTATTTVQSTTTTMPTTTTPSTTMSKTTPTTTMSTTPISADNDPHFVVKMKGTDEHFCFDVDGRDGESYQLIYDSETNLVVNAQLISAANDRTYFGKIFIQSGNVSIRVTLGKIMIANHPDQDWKKNMSIFTEQVKVTIIRKKSVEVDIDNGVTMNILRHKLNDGTKYLGFYVKDGSGLSHRAHGLIGQFQHRHARPVSGEDTGNSRRWEISRNGQTVRVVDSHRGRRRNMQSDKHIPCWRVSNQGENLLDGSAQNYRVNNLTARKLPKRSRQLAHRVSRRMAAGP